MAGSVSPNTVDYQSRQPTDQQQRKRMQNRLAQQNYRERMKRRIEDLEKWRYVALSVTKPSISGEILSADEEHLSMPLPISPPLSSESSKESPQTKSTEANQPDVSTDGDVQHSLLWDSPLEGTSIKSQFDFSQMERLNNTCNDGWRNQRSKGQEEENMLGLPMSRLQDNVDTSHTHDIPLPVAEVSGWVPDQSDQLQRPSRGKTALHLAAETGQIAVVRILLQRHIDPNYQDGEGRTALHLAVKNDHLALVQILTRVESENENERTNVNIPDYQGRTALHDAVVSDNVGMVELLLGVSSVELETKDEVSQTALHHASVTGNIQVVGGLITAGADIFMRVG